MAATFPAELTDRIIDFIHTDKRALLACSRVCKSWVPASRYHLFRELAITNAKAQSLLELFGFTATKDDTGTSGEPLPFISDILPRGLEVFNYVQSILCKWELETSMTNEAEALEDSFMQIIASFPRLSEFAGDFRHPTLGYLRNIKKLSVHRCYRPIDGVATAIANNPGLESLNIASPLPNTALPQLHDVFANIPPNSPPLKLRHLRVSGFHFHPSSMSHLHSLTSLEWLERTGLAINYSAELWQTLKSEKIRLSRLKTSLSHNSLLYFLSSFQGMKDLRLERLSGEDDEDSDRLARTLFQVLVQNHANTLETLHINAVFEADWCLVHHDITPVLSCTSLRELGTSVYLPSQCTFSVDTAVMLTSKKFDLLDSTSRLPSLRILQITTLFCMPADYETIHDAISRFDSCTGSDATRIPVLKVLAGDRWFEWREGKYRCTSDS